MPGIPHIAMTFAQISRLLHRNGLKVSEFSTDFIDLRWLQIAPTTSNTWNLAFLGQKSWRLKFRKSVNIFLCFLKCAHAMQSHRFTSLVGQVSWLPNNQTTWNLAFLRQKSWRLKMSQRCQNFPSFLKCAHAMQSHRFTSLVGQVSWRLQG